MSGPSGGSAPPRGARGALRRLGVAALAALVVLLSLYALRAPLLTGAARLLTVRDPLARADLILVLGGERYTRPRHAAALYRRGVAPRVVLIREEGEPETRLGLYPNGTDVSVAVLRRFGVPDSAIVVHEPPEGAGSTLEEARALRDYLRESGARRVVVVTNDYHSRRARWVLRRETRDHPAQLRMAPVETLYFDETNWWRRERGLVTYLNEYIKLFFYVAHLR